MKNSKLFYLAVLILPWLTIPFLGRNAFKRYLPASIFTVTFTKVLDLYGENKKWWKFYKGIPPFNSMNFFNLGPYFVASIWMLKMSYGKFLPFILSNIILHTFYTFIGLKYLKRYKIASLDQLPKLSYQFILFIRALILYGFQYINEWSSDREKRGWYK